MAEATRVAFGRALARVGADPRIVVLDADLASSTNTRPFAEKYPERFFQLGIAEGNMVGVAAGLALAGKIPFAASFACFVAGRFEQVRVSVAYNRANVRIVGTHAGDFFGLPASGRHVQAVCAFVYTLKDNQIVHERRILDFTGVLVQVGVLRAKPAAGL